MPTIRSEANRPQQRASPKSKKPSGLTKLGFTGDNKEPVWQCVKSCGACCKLDKGPSFPSPEEIFDNPSDIQLYRSLIGPQVWCIHFEQTTRTCSIYSDRHYFCRVEPDIFEQLYGIDKKKFNKEACRYVSAVWSDLIPVQGVATAAVQNSVKHVGQQ